MKEKGEKQSAQSSCKLYALVNIVKDKDMVFFYIVVIMFAYLLYMLIVHLFGFTI